MGVAFFFLCPTPCGHEPSVCCWGDSPPRNTGHLLLKGHREGGVSGRGEREGRKPSVLLCPCYLEIWYVTSLL